MNLIPILKRTPLKRRRRPRRGRVIDKLFLAWMGLEPCLIHGRHNCRGRITIHHVRDFGSPKNDRRTLALCEAAHLEAFSPDAIEHGKRGFEHKFSVSIEAAIRDYNARYDGLRRPVRNYVFDQEQEVA